MDLFPGKALYHLPQFWDGNGCFIRCILTAKPEMDSLGFRGVYLGRPTTHSSEWSGKQKKDGCAIFFRKSLFDLVETDTVNFMDVHDRVALLVRPYLPNVLPTVLVIPADPAGAPAVPAAADCGQHTSALG